MKFYILLFFSTFIYSQGLEITYVQTLNIDEQQIQNISDKKEKEFIMQQISKPTYFSLYHNHGTSLFKLKDMSNNNEPDIDKENTLINFTNNEIIYKDILKHELIIESDLLGQIFLIKDKLTPINWSLINENKKIGEFICKKAITNIHGVDVEAWYTTDLSISDGPAEFWGLPGLIINVNTKQESYQVTEIKPSNINLTINIPTKGKPITREKFEKTREQIFSELEENVYE